MQQINKVQLNFVYSSVIFALWTAIVLITFSPQTNFIFKNQVSTGILDNRFILFLLTRYFGLWSAIVVLLLRMLRIVKNKYSFIYIFVGLLNVGLGILSLVLFAFKQMDRSSLHMFIFNLTIGLIIFTDILFLQIILNNQQE